MRATAAALLLLLLLAPSATAVKTSGPVKVFLYAAVDGQGEWMLSTDAETVPQEPRGNTGVNVVRPGGPVAEYCRFFRLSDPESQRPVFEDLLVAPDGSSAYIYLRPVAPATVVPQSVARLRIESWTNGSITGNVLAQGESGGFGGFPWTEDGRFLEIRIEIRNEQAVWPSGKSPTLHGIIVFLEVCHTAPVGNDPYPEWELVTGANIPTRLILNVENGLTGQGAWSTSLEDRLCFGAHVSSPFGASDVGAAELRIDGSVRDDFELQPRGQLIGLDDGSQAGYPHWCGSPNALSSGVHNVTVLVQNLQGTFELAQSVAHDATPPAPATPAPSLGLLLAAGWAAACLLRRSRAST